MAAAAIDVEIEHRHRRLVGLCLAAPAAIGRTLQRARDPFRVAPSEYARRQIEGVALARDAARPLPRTARGFSGAFRRHGFNSDMFRVFNGAPLSSFT